MINSSIFQHIPTYSNIFQHIPTYSNILQHIPTYSNIFQHFNMFIMMIQMMIQWWSSLSGGKKEWSPSPAGPGPARPQGPPKQRLLLGRLGSHLLQRLGAFARGLLQGLVGLLGHAARLGVRDLLRCVLHQGLQLGHQGKHLRSGWSWWRWNQGFFKKCYLQNWCSYTMLHAWLWEGCM